MNGRQLDPRALADSTRAALQVPDTVQANELLYSLVNFVPVTKPVLDALPIEELVEIGCELGNHTAFLAGYAAERGARLTVVDVAPTLDPDLETAAHVDVVRARSADHLRTRARSADAYFVDGDHTYDAVAADLERIAALADKGPSPVVFVHDTSWPWGLRDAAYVQADAEAPGPAGAVDLYEDGLAQRGLPIQPDIQVAPRAGGEANGVRVAVDDFLSARGDWRGLHVQGCFGLSILWQPEAVAPSGRDALEALETACGRLGPFLSTLELGRLHALCELIDARAALERMRERRERRKRRLGARLGRTLRRLWPR